MKGRFAPSPTGAIHMGNIWVALISYLSVRSQGGIFVLRMEDIDLQRAKKTLGEALLDDLEWLGFDWDEGPRVGGPNGPYWQSQRYSSYEHLVDDLLKRQQLYPCFCNRARLQAIASAPHPGEDLHPCSGLPIYDGHCRFLSSVERQEWSRRKNPSYRLALASKEYTYDDRWQGRVSRRLSQGIDDFILKRADGIFAYNLAVVLDDIAMGITEVIRGYDLLAVTPYHLALYDLLGRRPPTYGHIPLLIDARGYRLSKRQGGITVKELRNAGYSPQMIWGHLCRATGLLPSLPRSGISLQALLEIYGESLLESSVLHKREIICSF